MKKWISLLLTLLGLNMACDSKTYEDADVNAFDALLQSGDVQLLDVRTSEEYAKEHLDGALNIDVKASDFVASAKSHLDVKRTVAVYCRSGRRSVTASKLLAAEGYRVVNLKGGIQAWKEQKRPVTSATVELDVFQTSNDKEVKFFALMHGSIRIQYEDVEIEVDPVRKLGDRSIDFTTYPKADYILVTHEHADHFDQEAIAQLSTEKTLLITNERCASMIGYGEVMKNGDFKELRPDIKLEAVPAYNITEGHLQFHPKGRDNGFILTLDDLRIYIAGDTEDIPEMASLNDIDVAFLPCNQPYTMTPEQLVHAAQMCRPLVLFPYHYGQTDVSSLSDAIKDEEIEVRIRHYE